MKHAIRAALTAAIAFALTLGGQAAADRRRKPRRRKRLLARPKSGEKTVEEAYLQESAEAAMVKELSHEDGIEAKQLALDYARRGVDAGGKATMSGTPSNISPSKIPSSSCVAEASGPRRTISPISGDRLAYCSAISPPWKARIPWSGS